MNVLIIVLLVLNWALWVFLMILIARFVLGLIMMFAPQWHPKGPLLLLFEAVYSVTDPPLRPLRRILPPVGAGGVRFDISMMMLFILVWLAMNINQSIIVSL
jgi:YggT family protein